MVVVPGSHGSCTLDRRLKAPVEGVLVRPPGPLVALLCLPGLSPNAAPKPQAPLTSCFDLPRQTRRMLPSRPAALHNDVVADALARRAKPLSALSAHMSRLPCPAPIARLRPEVRHLTPSAAAAARGVGPGRSHRAM